MESDPLQVICFGFLLVLTPSNWDELLRRLVRYLFSKSTHAHSTNRYRVYHISNRYQVFIMCTVPVTSTRYLFKYRALIQAWEGLTSGFTWDLVLNGCKGLGPQKSKFDKKDTFHGKLICLEICHINIM